MSLVVHIDLRALGREDVVHFKRRHLALNTIVSQTKPPSEEQRINLVVDCEHLVVILVKRKYALGFGPFAILLDVRAVYIK